LAATTLLRLLQGPVVVYVNAVVLQDYVSGILKTAECEPDSNHGGRGLAAVLHRTGSSSWGCSAGFDSAAVPARQPQPLPMQLGACQQGRGCLPLLNLALTRHWPVRPAGAAVVVVGYDTVKRFWVVRNSW
jgi:hypothetical protein